MNESDHAAVRWGESDTGNSPQQPLLTTELEFNAMSQADALADEPTYRIRRFCFNDNHPDHHRVIDTGLTLEEAQAHCQDESTHGEDAERGPWFDGYDEE